MLIKLGLSVPHIAMTRIDALLFMVGMVLSLGSIATFIVMNVVVGSSSDLMLIHHQRIFAVASSQALTVPGVCMLLAAAILSWGFSGRQSFHDVWDLAQLILTALIFINTVFFIRPLVAEVSLLAERSAAQGQMLNGYKRRKKLEDRLGAANLLMMVTTLLLAVAKP